MGQFTWNAKRSLFGVLAGCLAFGVHQHGACARPERRRESAGSDGAFTCTSAAEPEL